MRALTLAALLGACALSPSTLGAQQQLASRFVPAPHSTGLPPTPGTAAPFAADSTLSLERHVLVGAAVGAVMGVAAGVVAYRHSPSCCYGADGKLRWLVPVYATVVGTLAGAAGGSVVYVGRRLGQR